VIACKQQDFKCWKSKKIPRRFGFMRDGR